MSNTPFLFIGMSFIVSISYLLLYLSGFLLSYLLGYPFVETLYPRLHQCFFLGASCCSPNFCFNTLR